MNNQRNWLIELVAYWEGRVTSRHLCEQFKISRQQASKDLNSYNATAPTPLTYRPESKGYVLPNSFSYECINGQVEEYLHWLATSELPATKQRVEAELLKPPQRQMIPQIMRGLIKAIREQRRLDVDYVSLNSPNHEGRVLVPHSFVETGARWHLRAWCEKHSQYRDFVLSRFRGEPELMDVSPHGKEGDVAWNTQVELVLKPDVRLSPEQQQVLIDDYAMQHGQLVLKTRAALATYLLKQMQVNFKTLEAEPKAQQLMLVNLGDIKQWLIG